MNGKVYTRRDPARRISRYRIMNNLRQSEFANKLGITLQQLQIYERGARFPKLNFLEKIAHTLNVDPLDMSCIELSEEDEKRILMKLLAKYCDAEDVKIDQRGNSFFKFDVEFLGFAKAFKFLPKHADMFLQSEGYDNTPGNNYPEGEGAWQFWLDKWPKYDLVYNNKESDLDNEAYDSNFLRDWYRYEEDFVIQDAREEKLQK